MTTEQSPGGDGGQPNRAKKEGIAAKLLEATADEPNFQIIVRPDATCDVAGPLRSTNQLQGPPRSV